MACTVATVIEEMERLAPQAWALEGDKVGLQVGRPDQPVSAVLVALDLTEAALAQAARAGAELILTHHPFLYQPLAGVRTDQPRGRLLAGLLAEGRALYVAHTNLDGAPEIGTSAVLGGLLGLRDPRPLLLCPGEAGLKLVTFLPAESVASVREALAAAGAGIIREYTECAFAVTGEGQFRAPREAHPVVGEAGAANSVPEVRLEMALAPGAEKRVVEALRAAHPYEEPAVDLYPLRPQAGEAAWARLGELPEALTAAELAARLAKALPGAPVHWAGDPERRVSRVAVLPGAGNSGVEGVAESEAEAFVTGELDLHRTLEAVGRGLVVITGGHVETEAPCLAPLARALGERLAGRASVTAAPAEPVWH